MLLVGWKSVCNAISCDVDQNKSPRDEPSAYEEEKRTQCVIKNAEFPSHSENSYFSLSNLQGGWEEGGKMIEWRIVIRTGKRWMLIDRDLHKNN